MPMPNRKVVTLRTQPELQRLLGELTQRAFHHAPTVIDIVVPLFVRVVRVATRGSVQCVRSRSTEYAFTTRVGASIAGKQLTFGYHRPRRKIYARCGAGVLMWFDNRTTISTLDKFVHAMQRSKTND